MINDRCKWLQINFDVLKLIILCIILVFLKNETCYFVQSLLFAPKWSNWPLDNISKI